VDPQTKSAFQAVIFSILFVLLFLILLPAVVRLLDETWGRVLYGVLVLGAVGVAFRLRLLAKRLF
jgi:hypothetical protein